SNSSLYPLNRNNDYSRYPYSNNPNQPLQNTNYKDWLNNCQGDTQYSGNLETFSRAETVAAVSAGLNVVGTLLTGFAATAPFGIAFIVFGTVLPFFIKDPTQPNETWDQFMKIGETAFKKEISETVRELSFGYIDGFKNSLHEYEELFKLWCAEKIPNQSGCNRNANTARAVQISFAAINHDFLTILPHFQTPTYKILLLPVFTQLALLHLNLLQQAAQFYDEWNLDQSKSITPTSSSAHYYDVLTTKIKEYVNYCTSAYKEGLAELKTKTKDWNIYNTYRREMTITVLDYIALFSNFDICKYPIAIKSELTREIYSEALILNRDKTLDEQEALLTRSPHLFSYLTSLNLYYRNSGKPRYLLAVQNNFVYINENNIKNSNIYKPRDINQSDLSVPTNISFLTNNKTNKNYRILMKIDQYRTDIYKMLFNFVSADSSQFLLDSNVLPHSREFNAEIVNSNLKTDPVTHILSYMKISDDNYSGGIGKYAGVQTSFAWTPDNINFNNTIYEKNITQISAIKARNISSQTKIIKNPGHLGGDCIQFNYNSASSELPFLELQCQTSTFSNNTAKNYILRIRYAANVETTLSVVLPNIKAITIVTRNTMSSSINKGEFLYEQFGYIDVFPRHLPISLSSNRLITLRISQLSASQQNPIVVIDKIEFIPIDALPINTKNMCETTQTIEMTTNNVFTDYTKNSLKPETTDYEIDQ
ncbi:insecticidal delta-endotoxin Cry8Ea1 family protein, partial [Bacillus thuringiensis]|uniref:insecticidal delta-endotoxin Cry8Ea1 family protein n=1 Tax=Bacillus thuringiensis TaxID=1428 RepID=UPI002E1964C4